MQPKQQVEYRSSQMIKESVEAGLGIAVLSKWIVHKELRWNTLCELPLLDSPSEGNFQWWREKAILRQRPQLCSRNF
ncbi:LysR substrate-binding domain-containing protein [Paenibacillus hexagrammi]|uniref:LysR substrate-binding domain-containing protein n=1 Tax=Paenibacillus hexagrammi TaxID=2908839 RepID=A0ABY3SSE8_9BACL|nr:LysR substrate-binding domain-containing protein [Paenibacillus sp. YPD9-1]UJF36358.1 LysR substrate-binding domain-containing protein [Paenibacillus sp. YPD9-1]